jgi:hypothetical protein
MRKFGVDLRLFFFGLFVWGERYKMVLRTITIPGALSWPYTWARTNTINVEAIK